MLFFQPNQLYRCNDVSTLLVSTLYMLLSTNKGFAVFDGLTAPLALLSDEGADNAGSPELLPSASIPPRHVVKLNMMNIANATILIIFFIAHFLNM